VSPIEDAAQAAEIADLPDPSRRPALSACPLLEFTPDKPRPGARTPFIPDVTYLIGSFCRRIA
jgi:hypothetical protein